MFGSYKDLFIGLDHGSYFYTGAESPSLKSNIQAVTQYLVDKSKGEEGRKRASKVEDELKGNLAQMINAKKSEIAFSGNASEAINNLVDAMEIPEGSNVILNDLEYPSVILPWLSLQKEKGIEVRVIQSKQGEIDAAEIERSIDEKTCLVAVSHVSYLNGFRHDLTMLRELTNRRNVPLLVDTTQSLGVIEVDSRYFDMMVASSYKWLLGPHGIGVLYVAEEYLPKIRPKRVGWRSVPSIFQKERFEAFELRKDAVKLELGFSNYPAIYALKNSTDLLLDIGIDKIEQHVLSLGSNLIYLLKERGWNVLTPDGKHSGNIAIQSSLGEEIMEQLGKQDVKVWGGDGRVRISVNFYNTEEDIQRVVAELASFQGKRS